MFARSAAAFFTIVFSLPSAAAVVSESAATRALTIYNIGDETAANFYGRYFDVDDGLALITESRVVDLPAGASEIEFRDVASTMVPQTADIQGLPDGALERNFDYDLLSPGSLLAKSIDKPVRLVRTDPNTGKLSEQIAVVRSAPRGVVLEIDGKYEALRCSGLPEKLIFDKVPDGLRDTPTLAVRVNTLKAGHYTIRLSYLATGLAWSADYIARMNASGNTLDLTGWLTLANVSATSFQQAPTDVVAGALEMTGESRPINPRPVPLIGGCWPTDIDWAKHRSLARALRGTSAPPRVASRVDMPVETVVVTGSLIQHQDLGDYKLYPLPEPATLPARQIKQIQFLDQRSVRFTRVYGYTANPYSRTNEEAHPTAIFRVNDTKADGLGEPLPRGELSIYEATADGIQVLIGQAQVPDISVGLPIEFSPSSAMNIAVTQRIVASETLGSGNDKTMRKSVEVTLENNKRIAIQFELGSLVNDQARVVAEDMPHQPAKDGVKWIFPLAAGQKKVFAFTVEGPDHY